MASVAAVLFATLVLLAVDFYLAAQPLVLGYLLPTQFVAIYYGSTLAVLTSFALGDLRRPGRYELRSCIPRSLATARAQRLGLAIAF